MLTEPLLERVVAAHGFGTRTSTAPEDVLRPKQVHGIAVVDAAECRGAPLSPEADAIVASDPGDAVAVVTADCVPVLLAAPGGAVVAAVHAGWRGLAAGVVAAGVEAVVARARCTAAEVVAGIGPHVGACCYEVDEPVLTALETAHGESARAASRATRPGHAQLDLAAVTRAALLAAGLFERRIGSTAVTCTACDAERFHSYRRDGPRSGRLVHFVRAGAVQG